VTDAGEASGRVIALGIPGPVLDAATRGALERLRPGVVILFRRNVEDPRQLRDLVAALHRLPSQPLVAIDHEGGDVTRLSAPFTAFPSAAELGRAGVDAARAVGEAIGRELASVDIDIDFAPVLDVGDANGMSTVGERAFGVDAGTVSAAGLAFAAGLLTGGVLPCGKHFPGHGATSLDSHVTRPVVTRSHDELWAADLVPFRAAVLAGLPMLMTAHVVYPAFDAERVATLAPAVAGKLLRRELGFTGVLWSDDLTMRAISAEQSPAEAAVQALAAGVDGVLICHDVDAAARAAERLRTAVRSGELSPTRLREAATRVAALTGQRPRRGPRLALPAPAHVALAEEVRVMAATNRAC
jgi:beta-N-acetylhexosaminidase